MSIGAVREDLCGYVGEGEWIDAGAGLSSNPSPTFANSFIFLCLSFYAYCFACLVFLLSRS